MRSHPATNPALVQSLVHTRTHTHSPALALACIHIYMHSHSPCTHAHLALACTHTHLAFTNTHVHSLVLTCVAIPGNTCPSGPLCVLSSHCVWATVSGVIRCWGDSVVGCSRATRAPPAAYQGTGQSGFRPQREQM